MNSPHHHFSMPQTTLPNESRASNPSGRFIYIACPWTPVGGGMFKVADYLIQAQAQAGQGGVQLRPLDTADAQYHLGALLAAFAAGLRAPLPLARKTAFAWLQVEAANAKAPPDKQKSAAALADATAAVASRHYDHSDGEHGRGEVDEEPALARSWPDFAALRAAGFEDWLHLYRPLLDAACVVDDDA